MKADTIFRFVAIRAPALRDGIVVIPGDNEAKRRIRESLTGMEDHGIRRIEARRLVGEKIRLGGDYWSGMPGADSLLRNLAGLRNLMQQQASAPDRGAFLDTLRRFSREFVSDADHLTPGSAVYDALKTRLWSSYYAIVLDPSHRAQDLPILREWLKALYLVDAADADTFAERARQWRYLRLSTPFAWLATGEAPTRPSAPTPPSQVDALTKRINELRGARATLNTLLLSKLQPGAASATKPRTIEDVIRISGDPSSAQWWDISQADQKAYAEALAIAAAAGVNHEVVPLPDVINALDDLISTLTFRVRQMRRRRALLLNGKTFVRVS